MNGADLRAIFMAMDGRYAENAGAIFGGCLDGSYAKKRNPATWGCLGMPKMQEQFSAGASMAPVPKNESCRMGMPRYAENAGALSAFG